MENDTVDMQRVWKEFGKHTEAGKLLYNIYGVKYNPEQHINYPKLILKTPEMKERERLEKERLKEEKRNKMTKAARKIDYAQGLRHYQPERYIPYGRVDFIPHRKNQNIIKYELDKMKKQMNAYVKKSYAGPIKSREDQIASLQDKFEFQERTVMPKAARLPALKMTDEQNKKQNEYIHNNFEMNRVRKGDKRGELENLYNKCIQEIDERYKHMEDMKKLGKNVDSEIMAEIKERINDMKSIEKLIEDYDKEHGKNK
jgi:hypothetical protein